VVVEAREYYPFGMVMPNRKTPAAGNSAYRYGFNGKENDDEAYGDDNQQDYGMRVYDPRLGRFLSVDPLFRDYPWNSTYAFAENDVIRNVDLDGAEKHPYTYLPQWAQNTMKIIDGTLQGLEQLAHDLAPIRPSDENDPKTLIEALDRIKNIPSNIKNIPDNLKNTYENGTLQEKAKATVGIVGMLASLTKGKANPSPTMLKVVQAGFNPRTRIVTFIQGTKEKVQQNIRVPDDYELVKISGSKADVFKQKGKNNWITPDLDSHTGGMWKMATGKAENLFKKETREGTYNADLTIKIGE
jgi:RHS repeat-associated protein